MANTKKRIMSPEKTRELQNDWQGYGKMTVYYGLVVFFIFMASFFYHAFMI